LQKKHYSIEPHDNSIEIAEKQKSIVMSKQDDQSNRVLPFKNTINMEKAIEVRSSSLNTRRTYSCSHCNTDVHGGRENTCPWENDSAYVARKLAHQALDRLNNDNVCPIIEIGEG